MRQGWELRRERQQRVNRWGILRYDMMNTVSLISQRWATKYDKLHKDNQGQPTWETSAIAGLEVHRDARGPTCSQSISSATTFWHRV